jgi:hypothetical protein
VHLICNKHLPTNVSGLKTKGGCVVVVVGGGGGDDDDLYIYQTTILFTANNEEQRYMQTMVLWSVTLLFALSLKGKTLFLI